jgi:tRNA (Thr-GGU) A37 N-methylase
MGWGYHQQSLPENELDYKQFFTVVHVDSIDAGDDTTVLDLKPYFHRMHTGPDVSGRKWAA